MKIKNLVLLSILITGCNNKNYYQQKLKQSFKLEISDHFKLVDNDKSFSTTGDYYESFGLKFSQKEFIKIFNSIKPKLAIADTNLYYYEIKNGNIFTELTFEPQKYTIYYTRIEE